MLEYLKKISIFICVFGLLGILIVLYLYEPLEVSISRLLLKDTKEGVYFVSGNLKNLESKSNTLFLEICDSVSCISCVYFNPSKSTIEKLENTLHNNHTLKIKGRFEYYYGSPEIIVYNFYFSEKG